MKGKLGIGLIGAMGRGAYIGKLFNESGRAEVRAVADIDPGAFDVGRERYTAAGARPELYDDVGGMLGRDDLDWVVVGTPDRTHYDLARQVVGTGRNVFVEKPMTQTTEDATALAELVDRQGVHLVVGCELRYSPMVETMRAAIRRGMIGRPIIGTYIDHVGRGYCYYLRDHRGKQWGGDMEEQWLAPAGNCLLGVSRITRADTTPFFEFMRIEQAADTGAITLTVHVRGGPGTPFKLVQCENNQAVFQNPANDPSEILYRLEPDGSLFAHIKGEKNGKPSTMTCKGTSSLSRGSRNRFQGFGRVNTVQWANTSPTAMGQNRSMRYRTGVKKSELMNPSAPNIAAGSISAKTERNIP